MCTAGNHSMSEEILTSQALCIENLQQQVYFLESEISRLRYHAEHENRLQPLAYAEAEKMVKKLAEAQKEIQSLKADIKRKQASIDYLKSEKERISRKFEENENNFHTQKNEFLEDIVKLRKEKNEYSDRCGELERLLEEKVQQENHLQGECDSFRVQVEELQKEVEENRKAVEILQEGKREAERCLVEANMRLEVKSVLDRDEAIKLLKAELEKLFALENAVTQTANHEKLLRSRLAEDNENLIKKHACTEAELAEARAKLREQEMLRASLEEIHLKTVLECSETKSELTSVVSQMTDQVKCLKIQKERCLQLATQVADEQRLKNREEQRACHLERQLEQKDDKIKARERENVELLRDNAALRDELASVREQLKSRDDEVEQLKRKVQDMHASVEEFVQNTKAATRLEGQRWKQLTQLAHGIQTLSEEAVLQKDL